MRRLEVEQMAPAAESTPVEAAERVTPPRPTEPPRLSERVASWQTLSSFGIAFALLGFFLYRQGPATLAQSWAHVRRASPPVYALALVAYYMAFPIRGYRWRILLLNSGEPEGRIPPVLSLSRIIYLSWFANSIVPAKLGDVYRGWLLRQGGGATWSHALGTIVAERMLDLIVLVTLMIASGFLAYGDKLAPVIARGPIACLRSGIHPQEAINCTLLQLFAVGGVAAVAMVLALLVFARFGARLERFLPGRLGDIYLRFRAGLVLSFGRFPSLLVLSILAWMAEGSAFWLVGRALAIQLALPLVIFFSLLQAFITVIPITPGGLGLEIVLASALALRGHPPAQAWAMTGLYRSISYLSLVIGGAIVYALTGTRRDRDR